MSNYNDKLRFAMTPSGYKAGTLYSQFPNVSASDFDVVRISNATRVNKDGLVELLGTNIPRLDYSDGGCPKLLTEASSTNISPYSQDFSQWGKNQNPIITYGKLSPSGDNTAIQIDSTSASEGVTNVMSFNTSTTYVASIFVKANTDKSIIKFGIGSSIFVGRVALTIPFDINKKIFGTPTSAVLDYGYEDYPNDWVRVWVKGTTDSSNASSGAFVVYGNSFDNWSWLQWGVQVESSNLSSYIPTTTSVVTRQADQVSNAGDSSTFNSQSGVLLIDSKAISDVACLSLHDGTDVNRVSILQYVDISRFRFLIDNNGVNQLDFSTDDFEVGLDFKIAVLYSTNNTSFFINGLEVATFNYGVMPSQGTFNQISLNLGSAGFFDFYGKTKSIQHYDYLSDAEMEQLTGYDSYSAMTSQFNFNVL